MLTAMASPMLRRSVMSEHRIAPAIDGIAIDFQQVQRELG
jgi:hypothetical protein